MSKEIAIIDYKDNSVLIDIRKSLCPEANDIEFNLFIQQCKATGLNPFLREIWLIKGKGYKNKRGECIEGKAQIMTGINGFYTIANDHPELDGIEIIESESVIKIESANVKSYSDIVAVKIVPPIYAPEWVEARVWRKDRRFPSTARAKWAEYAKDVVSSNGNRTVWGEKPSVMLSKCAESMALRKAFPQRLNSMYTAEEMPAEFSQVEVETKPALASIPGLKTADDLSYSSNGKPDMATAQILNKKELEQPAMDVQHNENEKLGFGKHKEETWASVNQQYLEWLVGRHDPRVSPRALAEIERRAMNQAMPDMWAEDNIPSFEDEEVAA